MKTIVRILTAGALAMLCLSACNTSKEPFATAGEEDAPRILNTDIPEGSAGAPAQLIAIERTINFQFEIIVTPVKYTTISWKIDGEDVFEGAEIDMPLMAGVHDVLVTATTTKGLSTSRNFTVSVIPAAEDPVVAEKQILAAPGQNATITGSNLDVISSVLLGTQKLEIVAKDDVELTVALPASMAAGVYPVFFENTSHEKLAAVYADGGEYKAFTIAASNDPLVSTASITTKPGADVTVYGINLNNVQSLTVGGQNATVVSKSYGELVFTCPALEPGSYEISGLDVSGKAISFAGNPTGTVTITSEVVVWEGSFNVTWDTPFNALKDTLLDMVQVGTIVRGYVTGNGGQGCLATSWWNNIYTGEGDPNRGDSIINGDMVLEYTLTQTSLDLMAAQNGALFVGNGYTITKVTLE